jgi:hypothetical protein
MTTDAAIIEALRQGKTNEDVALELGSSPKRAARLRQQIGLAPTPPPGRRVLDPRQCSRAAALRAEGLSWPVIGGRLGCGPDAARDGAKRHEEGRA